MIKRIFDFFVSLVALVLLAPVLATIALMVRTRLGSPVFFRQVRPGLKGKPFELIKFRTMLDTTDAAGKPLSDSERLTSFGRFLRSTSLDELPELWNVLKGEMSLVGPRPLLVQYLSRYSAEQARRHEVRPGLTGWTQVNGRNALSWDEKFELDVWYVDHQCLSLDAKIILKTLRTVFGRQGISAAGNDTMPEFLGSKGSLGASKSSASQDPSG